MKSNQEILEILTEINNGSVENVANKINALHLYFSDWEKFSNLRLEGYDIGMLNESQLEMINDQKRMSYADFMKISRVFHTFRGHPDDSNRAKRARGRREFFRNGEESKEYTEYTDEQLDILPESEVIILEEIERIWNEVRIKYNPVMEINRICERTNAVFLYSATAKINTIQTNLDIRIEELKRNIEQLKKCGSYIENYNENNMVLAAIEEGLKAFEDLQQSEEDGLSVDEFIEKFGFKKEQIEEHLKRRLASRSSASGFIAAKEGKGFRLNENGELEIIDEKLAKRIIADAFFSSHVLGKQIAMLDEVMIHKNIESYIVSEVELDSQGVEENSEVDIDMYDDIDDMPEQDDDEIFDDIDEMFEQEEDQEQDLSSLSVEELQQIVSKNDRIIEENEHMKKQALIQKILMQQQQIKQQQMEIDGLGGPKKE